ncbi:AAA family ATPase [Natronorubrum halophilum]|uniref:AAA family ATPase n=1 Tax=Natronorubrum halophilum TaxID=1702106 RepID=UPI0010C1DDE7|nr:AAA family ATPase [Natronorubrum halophilum]
MVEVDAQVLVGAAITVFLALMFFGVVVLWDVALALRSVGDKIDKLEDNVDDDLMDIAYSLDNISNAPGGNGTQLHLNSGSISSGPATGQAPGEPTQQTRDAQTEAADGGPRASQQRQQPVQNPQKTASAGVAGTTGSSGDAAGGESDPDSDAVRAGSDAGTTAAERTEAVTAPVESDPTPTEDDPDGEAERTHPRAAINRGRFITSPDRTAWYATPLDREAIRTAEPLIAGELTDGTESRSDESEVIAVGPVDATAAVDPTDPNESTDGLSGEPVEAAGTATEARGSPSAADEPTDTDLANDGETEESEPKAAEYEREGDSTAVEADAGGLAFDASADEPGDEPDERVSATGTDLEPAGIDSDTEAGDRSDTEERPDAETDAAERTGTGGDDPPAETEADHRITDGSNPFEFDDEFADDVTVEEAVDTINENAPAPELSSHRFDVTAEVHATDEGEADGDSAVLIFEFDADTVDLSGSTKRLLQYQMRSFADRDSTPHGDVTIGRQRIVIEIPNSDGSAVQRWGEAAVSIIDRTLYLSDNSSDDS